MLPWAALAIASCGGSSDTFSPPVRGGSGTVVSLPEDAGGHSNVDGGRDMHLSTTTGTGGSNVGTGGAGGGALGGHGATGGNGGAPSAGGAAGSAVQDDPCTACEKKKCSHPVGLDSDTSSDYAKLVAAYEVCFLGTGWPTSTSDPTVLCNGPSETVTAGDGWTRAWRREDDALPGSLAMRSSDQLHRRPFEDTPYECYCGAGVDLQTCEGFNFVPTGACVSQVANALELTVAGHQRH